MHWKYSHIILILTFILIQALTPVLIIIGNCKNASAGFPDHEAYPCFYDQVTYGLAVIGLNTSTPTLPVHVDVNRQDEPDPREKQKPVELAATVEVVSG